MEHTRRSFLGSTAALGSVALASAGAGVMFSGSAAAQQEEDALVVRELERQARDGVKAMRTRPGEGLRRVAGSLRIFAAHAKSRKHDQRIAQQLRTVIRKHGREALVYGSLDPTAVNSEFRALGIARPFPVLAPNPKVREELLDDLLAGRFSARVVSFAELLERQGTDIDRAGVAVLPVRRIPGCMQLEMQMSQAQAMMLIFCNPIFSGVYLVTCVFWSSFAATTYAQMEYYGC